MTPSTASHTSALLRAETASGWDAAGRVWTSEPLSPGFDADQVVASWNLVPATGGLIEISAADAGGGWGAWLTLAAWDALPGTTRTSPAPGGAAAASDPAGTNPGAATTAPDPTGTALGPATVETDVLTARPGRVITAARLRVTLSRPAPGGAALTLAALHFSAPAPTAAPTPAPAPTAAPTPAPTPAAAPTPVATDAAGPATGVGQRETHPAVGELRPLSQRQHKPRTDLGGGGSVWCSPTSLTMVMQAWGVDVPQEEARTDVPPTDGDPRVPWAAARVFDPAFGGTGNWTFNAALAGHLGLDAVVTRLRGLDELAVLTRAGLPVICSVAFRQEDMPGADYSTAGHLLVALGLDADGNVRVADPACGTPQEGLRTYPADAFDAAWATSRRTVYLLSPRGAELPAAPAGSRSW